MTDREGFVKVSQMLVGQMANFSYIVADEKSMDAAIVDPSWNLEIIYSTLKTNNWNAKYIINTHSHFDHILGNEQVAEATGAKIVQHENSDSYKDLSVKDGQVIMLGDVHIKVMFTPGHSNDSICLTIYKDLIFTGDTLFVGNCGRTDLQGGDPALLYESLYDKIMTLNDSMIVYPGHDYGPTPSSTIYNEKMSNPVLKFRSRDSFLKYLTR
ncbi:MAG TPA: MBL fold metallo-hydrolase [Nitrososphaeraceae archaeon]